MVVRPAFLFALVMTGALLQVHLPVPAPVRAKSPDTAPPPARTRSVTLSVTPAWGDVAGPGQLIPLHIRLASRDRLTAPIRVRLIRSAPFDESTAVFELRDDVDVPAGGEWATWLLLPAGPTRDRLHVEAGPASVSLQPFDPASRASPRAVALVLSSAARGWEFLGGWRPRGISQAGRAPQAPGALRVVYLSDPSAVPPWFSAYEAVDLVVLASDFPAERLSPAQREALLAYARGGGLVAIPQRAPSAWAPFIERLEAASQPPACESPPFPVRFGLRLLRLPMDDEDQAQASFTRAAPELGLQPVPPDQAPGRPGGRSTLAEDALRAQLFAALAEAPVRFPPRWASLVAIAYAGAGWSWVRRFRRHKPGKWLAAGLAMVGVASVGAVAGAAVFIAGADRPQAVLFVRPGHLTGASDSAPVRADGPVKAELLVSFSGLFSTPWEVRPAPGAVALLPAPQAAAELARGTAGVRVRRSAGDAVQGAWQVEPLAAKEPGAVPAETAVAGWRSPGSGGWHGLFYVDAPLADLVQHLPAHTRAAIVSPAGVVAAEPSELVVLGRTAILGERVAQALAEVERSALYPGAGVLGGLVVEALAAVSADASVQAMLRAVASAVAEAAAAREEVAQPGDPVRYAVFFGSRTARPMVEARRPGGRWAPVPTSAIVVSVAVPAGEALERGPGGP